MSSERIKKLTKQVESESTKFFVFDARSFESDSGYKLLVDGDTLYSTSAAQAAHTYVAREMEGQNWAGTIGVWDGKQLHTFRFRTVTTTLTELDPDVG